MYSARQRQGKTAYKGDVALAQTTAARGGEECSCMVSTHLLKVCLGDAWHLIHIILHGVWVLCTAAFPAETRQADTQCFCAMFNKWAEGQG
jgi:hypothetical protein